MFTTKGSDSRDRTQATTTATPRLSFAASFDDPTNADPLPSPLKNIFGLSASPIMLAAGSPLKSHQECGGVELNPRFSVQMEAAAAKAAAKAATSPKRTKSPIKKIKKKQSTDERKSTIPRLWTDEVSHATFD